MAVTPNIPADTDIAAIEDHEIGRACGDNAMNWARAFCATAKKLGHDLGDDAEGWMVGWFANAIECAQDARSGGGPAVLPDGSAFFTS